jgi:Flp pilus assembly protein TadD
MSLVLMMLLRLSRLVLIAFLVVNYSAATESRNVNLQDIEGGARRIFAERPANPITHQTSQSKEQRSASEADKTVTNEGVEDALALGNSARDANPPRYADAEKAYRLAAKINPSDARSYIGMGNILYDQRHYLDAAKMYRQALSLMSAAGKRQRTGERGLRVDPELARRQASYHAQLGTCLLLANRVSEAETEFLEAIRYASKDARLYALLGYSYFLQKRFNEASSEFKTAIRLDPNNPVYGELLKSVTK